MKIARLLIKRRALAPGRDGFLVIAEDERGLAGLGEASPLPGYSPDDAFAVGARLAHASLVLSGAVLDGDVDAVGAALDRAELDLECSPSARFALETALLDLLARRRQVPLHELLSGSAPRTSVLPRSGLLPRSATGDELLASASAAVARGLRTLKVKIDPALVRERFTDLVRLRDAFGGVLRFDANGAFAAEEVPALFDRLAPLEPEIIEEPTRGEGLLRLGETACAWAADESLADAQLADAIVERASCAAIVLKPGLLGGLLRARALAERAESRGLGVVVTHALDGPVALAAACELALSLDEPPLACGLDPHAALEAWPACRIAQLEEQAHVTAGVEPGLGLEREHFEGERW